MSLDINFLNLQIFEVVRITSYPDLSSVNLSPFDEIVPKVSTVSLHPLVTGPRSIHYTDRSRSDIQQSIRRATVNKGNRELLRLTLAGTFGQEPRFMGVFLDGLRRLKLFWHEAVRLGDAVTEEQVKKAKRIITPSHVFPAYNLPFDERFEVYGINFYDFYNGWAFSCNIDLFDINEDTSANNLPMYTIQITETGPTLVNQNFLSAALTALIEADQIAEDALNTLVANFPQRWIDAAASISQSANSTIQKINDVWKASFRLDTERLKASWNGLADRFRSQTTISFSGTFVPPTVAEETTDETAERDASAAKFRDKIKGIQAAQEHLMATIAPYATEPGPRREMTEIALHRGEPFEFDEFLRDVEVSQVAAYEVENMHRLYQLSQEEHNERLAALTSGENRPPAIPSTRLHRIEGRQTIFDIADQYGVSWETLLEYNDLEPDDIHPGMELVIPITKEIGAVPFPEVPTFGSHRGASVLGTDLPNALDVDEDGDLLVLDEPNTFLQGIDNIIILADDFFFSEDQEILSGNELAEFMRIKLFELLNQDKRIRDITKLDVVNGNQGVIVIDYEVRAISDPEIANALAQDLN